MLVRSLITSFLLVGIIAVAVIMRAVPPPWATSTAPGSRSPTPAESAGGPNSVAIAPSKAARPSPDPGAGYWHTSGRRIVDARGQPVRIAGVTWYGMESTYWVPAGLDYQPYTGIMSKLRSLGYNTIRLPISNELVESNPIVTTHVHANPNFRGKHALTVLDAIVREASHVGLKIILDDQISRAERPHDVNHLDEPLWYTRQYPQSAWIADWKTLARRYQGQSAVIGFDLRNEPHTAGPGPWNVHAYLYQGATWGPYRGWDNPATDWRLAAERAGNAVLSINPRLLIFVEGVQLYPDPTQTGGVQTGWWGWNLSMVKRYPVVLKVRHHLVYSTHDYGPLKVQMPWFAHNTYAIQKRMWHAMWSYLLDDPYVSYAAPILLGEFGTCTNLPTCVDDVRPGNQAQWFHFVLRFLKGNPEIGWSFFALNGTNANNSPANNGLFKPDWSGVRNQRLQRDLASIQRYRESRVIAGSGRARARKEARSRNPLQPRCARGSSRGCSPRQRG